MQLNLKQENQMMTQFQEVMSLLKQANSTQNTATSDNKNNECKPGKSKHNNNKAQLNHANTAGLMEHVPPPVQNATTKQTITVMKQLLRIFLVDHLLVATGCYWLLQVAGMTIWDFR